MFIYVADPTITWSLVRKVGSIKARLIELGDPMAGTTISTLEGPMTVNAGWMLCSGALGEQWVQTADHINEAYTKTNIQDVNGFYIWLPRNATMREAVQITEAWCTEFDFPLTGDTFTMHTSWGLMTADGKFTQTGHIGDWVVRNQTAHKDVRIVRNDVFVRTYSRIGDE